MEIEVKQLVLAVRQIAEEKNLEPELVHSIIEQAIAAAWRKDYGEHEQEVTAQINSNTGSVKVFVHMAVVDEVEDPHTQMTLSEAKKINKKAEVGKTVEIVHQPTTFGRVAAQTAKQVILQKLREAEREVVLEEYSDKIGTVVNGTVSRVEQRIVRVDLGKASGILPKSEQIQGEYYSIGARIKVFLKDVERSTRGPQLILSRANEDFIKLLFQNEVPEMESGAVEIKGIAREAGVRTKIAVASNVPGVDPVGTFVGGHGTRVQAVMSEIGDKEKIDIITYDDDTEQYIKNALSPTEVDTVKIDKKTEKAVVKVREDQLSIAIGKGGQNVRLASKLTGYDLDIQSADGTIAATVKSADEEPAKPKRKKSKNIEDSLLEAIEEVGEGEDSETPADVSDTEDEVKSETAESESPANDDDKKPTKPNKK